MDQPNTHVAPAPEAESAQETPTGTFRPTHEVDLDDPDLAPSTASADGDADDEQRELQRQRLIKARGTIGQRVADLTPTLGEDLLTLDRLERRLASLGYASTIINFNGETCDPPRATTARGEALGELEQLRVEILCGSEMGGVLERLKAQSDDLTDTRRAQLHVLMRDRREAMVVPPEEQAAFTRLTVEADAIWRHAKITNDWDMFEPYLDRIVEALRKQASLLDDTRDPYDVWLDRYERGTSMAFYDELFDQLKACVVPLVGGITRVGWQPSTRCVQGRFDVERQLRLSRELMELEGVPSDALVLAQTEHPFSDGVSSGHAFIATHIYEDDVLSNVYTMLHEGGHALYELNVDPSFDYTSLRGGTSMGIHESQSRFFENTIGRSRAFMKPLLEVMARCFPGRFNGVSQRELYQAANRAEPTLIRTEADELTYPLHIIVRYEIEKRLFSGELSAADVPGTWDMLYHRYLGIRVPNDSMGALQDTHWAWGSLGYFPTYALGTAYDAQFLHAMHEDGLDVEACAAEGNLAPVRAWLRGHVWRYGRALDAPDIIMGACGEPFDATYYTDYLEAKYRELYRL